MEYLGRDGAPFSEELWEQIDKTVIGAAKKVVVGRRFLPFTGPIGPAAQVASINKRGRSEEFADGFVKVIGRQVAEIPELYADFWLYWRDLETSRCEDAPADLSAAVYAAQSLAQTEDRMIFYGIPELSLDGLLTVKGSLAVKRGDWSTGEVSFTDVANAVTQLEDRNYLTSHTLVLSPDLYMQLHRIQPGTGMLELTRVQSLVDKVIKATVLQEKTALLVAAEAYCMDLVVGQDMQVAYLEAVDMNHHLRVMETALLRIKAPDAIVVLK